MRHVFVVEVCPDVILQFPITILRRRNLMSYEDKATAEIAAIAAAPTDDQKIEIAQTYALLHVADQLKSVRAVLDNLVANQLRRPC